MKFAATVILLALLPLLAAEPVRAVLFPFRETVISSQLESRLLPYQFRIGQHFKKGEVLVQLDAERFELEHKRAADQYDFCKTTYETRQNQRQKGFTSDYELKKSEFEFKMAQNALNESKLRLKYCSVIAPFDGKIQEITTREYETVRPGQPLCRIIDDNHLLAVLNVPQGNKTLTTPGNEVRIKMDSGEIVSGKIYEVAPQADHRTGTVRIRVLLDNRRWRLAAGSTGELYHGK